MSLKDRITYIIRKVFNRRDKWRPPAWNQAALRGHRQQSYIEPQPNGFPTEINHITDAMVDKTWERLTEAGADTLHNTHSSLSGYSAEIKCKDGDIIFFDEHCRVMLYYFARIGGHLYPCSHSPVDIPYCDPKVFDKIVELVIQHKPEKSRVE